MRANKLFLLLLFLMLFLISGLSAQSPWTGKDKAMHLIGSTYLVYWNYHLNREVLNQQHTNSMFLAVSLTSFTGTGKEITDRYVKKTKFSWQDMVYNAAGIAVGVILIEVTR